MYSISSTSTVWRSPVFSSCPRTRIDLQISCKVIDRLPHLQHPLQAIISVFFIPTSWCNQPCVATQKLYSETAMKDLCALHTWLPSYRKKTSVSHIDQAFCAWLVAHLQRQALHPGPPLQCLGPWAQYAPWFQCGPAGRACHQSALWAASVHDEVLPCLAHAQQQQQPHVPWSPKGNAENCKEKTLLLTRHPEPLTCTRHATLQPYYPPTPFVIHLASTLQSVFLTSSTVHAHKPAPNTCLCLHMSCWFGMFLHPHSQDS